MGRASGIDMISNARDIYDVITDENITPGDFDFIRTQARDLHGSTVEATATAIAALAFRDVALGLYGLGGAAGEFIYPEPTGTPYVIDGITVYDDEFVAADGDALWQWSAAAALSHQLNPRLAIGATIRRTELSFREKYWRAEVVVQGTPPTPHFQVPKSAAPSLYDHATTADLGLLYQLEPRVKAGLVVRNITSPKFTLSDGVAPPRTFKADLTIDTGLAITSEDGAHLLAFDLHNIGSQNGGDTTVHIGYEWRTNAPFVVRVGASEFGYTAGLGIEVGSVHLNLATGEQAKEQAGLSFGFEF